MNLSATIKRALYVTILAAAATQAGCVAEPMDGDTDGPESTGQETDAISGTVAHAEETSCSTDSVRGLSLQIIAEGRCLHPGSYAKMPARSNFHPGGSVFAYLEQPARDALVSALDAHPGRSLEVGSMLRTIAQQYLLYRWYEAGRCGIPLAATPGHSNHESGLAFDTNDEATWRTSLENHGFRWYGSQDRYHFDYVGKGATDHRGLDVEAFQRLWNRNHPGDKIAVDGDWGPQTEARMKKAPAAGFPLGATCN
jgi:hypothetical protein